MDTRRKMHRQGQFRYKTELRDQWGDERVRDGSVDGYHVPTEAASKEKEGDPKHHRKAPDEQVERPFLEPIVFPLTVSATLNHRPTSMPQVSIQPRLSQHGDECCEKRHQKARIQEASGSDDHGGTAWDSFGIRIG